MTRLVIELNVEPCHHKNAQDFYEEGKSYPTLYHCPDCGSKFPVTGDTDLWAEGVRVTEGPTVRRG